MTEDIQRLIAALRDELQQYGEMLAILDRQREVEANGSAQILVTSVAVAQAQAGAIQIACANSEKWRKQVAQDLRQPAFTPLVNLIPLFPAVYRPLIEALVEENQELLVRVHLQFRQDNLLGSAPLDLNDPIH